MSPMLCRKTKTPKSPRVGAHARPHTCGHSIATADGYPVMDAGGRDVAGATTTRGAEYEESHRWTMPRIAVRALAGSPVPPVSPGTRSITSTCRTSAKRADGGRGNRPACGMNAITAAAPTAWIGRGRGRDAARMSTRPPRTRLRALPYAVYLRTAHWRQVRLQALKRAQYQCERCPARGRLDVHHTTYAHLGQEQRYLKDLQVLCRPCHDRAHGKRPGPQKRRSPSQRRSAKTTRKLTSTKPRKVQRQRRSRRTVS